ncbi:MAG: TraR/DksA family transcriptional regulator [Bacteriovoracaceae bacterium]|nr:TraR/DksA family transcriptional regulator [Bacteriovoracaceae bacterium]
MRFVEEGADALKAQLEESRNTILSRLNKLEDDRTRKAGPLDPDWEEQAVELQNEQVLEQLDKNERIELQKINSALERIDRGVYGRCVTCGDDIDVKRLKAMPTATQCIDCVEMKH